MKKTIFCALDGDKNIYYNAAGNERKNAMTEKIRQRLFENQDLAYRTFQAKLMPGVSLERIIGVRTPVLRKLAKELAREPGIEAFLQELPHSYYEENNLHAFILCECRDYGKTVAGVDALLPYVDNWATCDSMSPRVFRNNHKRLAGDLEHWLASDQVYTVRFGIEMVMSHFLDADFEDPYLERIARIRSDAYYINMMIAWFFATALAKQWKSTVPYLEGKRLDPWVHNKTIQKAIESYRITEEQKTYLRSLKM